MSDDPAKLLASYQYTAEKPMRYALDRWQLMLRIARLLEAGVWKSPHAASQELAALRLTRQELAAAYRLWRESTNRLQLAQSEPTKFQVGRYGHGVPDLPAEIGSGSVGTSS